MSETTKVPMTRAIAGAITEANKHAPVSETAKCNACGSALVNDYCHNKECSRHGRTNDYLRSAPAPSGSVEGERDVVTDEAAERFLVALGGRMLDSRHPWHPDDYAMVRHGLAAVFGDGTAGLAPTQAPGSMRPPEAQRAAPHREGGSGEVTEAARLVLAERERQKAVEGWSTAHDDDHTDGSLAQVASCYAMPPEVRSLFDEHEKPGLWPESWALKWWKPTPDDRVRELVKAGALILAEIERLQRAEAREGV